MIKGRGKALFLLLAFALLVSGGFAVDYTQFLSIAPGGGTNLNTDYYWLTQTFTGNDNYTLYILTYKESTTSMNSPPTTIQVNLSFQNGTQIGNTNWVNFPLDGNYKNISFVSPLVIEDGGLYIVKFTAIDAGVLGLRAAYGTNPYAGGQSQREEGDHDGNNDYELQFWGLIPDVPGPENPLDGNGSSCVRVYATRPRVLWNQSQFSYFAGDFYENIIFPGASVVLNSMTDPGNYSYCSEYVGVIGDAKACFYNVSFIDSYRVRFFPNLNCHSTGPSNQPNYTYYNLGILYINGSTNASYVTAYSNSPVVENTGGIKNVNRIGSMFYEILKIGLWVIVGIAVVFSAVLAGPQNWPVPVIVFIIGIILKLYVSQWGL